MADRLEITYRPISELRVYARNARTHSEEQIRQIAASIEAFGWTNPILVDEAGGLIAGHGRLRAATSRGQAEVPTLTLTGLTQAQKRALVIADNKLALNAGWDVGMLASELQALDTGEFALGLTGFSEGELERLLAWAPGFANGLTDPDEVPAAPEVPVTLAGDVWLLGKHRVLCGDATSAEAVVSALGQVRPHLMVTDPPYGVSYEAGWRNESMPAKNDPTRWKDGAGRAIGKVLNDDRADWREAWALFPGDVAYIWHAGNKAHMVADSLLASGFDIRAQIDKPHKSETGHSTQKPVECMRRPIENNSSPGQAVYDPFLGSGTTVIAAEMTGRACIGIELNPAYVDVTVERWQNFTGKTATLESTGAPFQKVNHGERAQATAVASEAH